MNKQISLFILPLLVSGCMSLEPVYKRPENSVPSQFYSTKDDVGITEATYQPIQWDEYIRDYKMKRVIDIALQHNTDLKIALANIESARAQYRISKSSQLPSIAINGTASKGENVTGQFENFESSLGMTSYEIDFFGRVKNLSDAALSSFIATSEAKKATQVSVVAATVDSYITLASTQSKLKIAQETYNSAQDSLKIIKLKYDNGIGTQIDVSNAETILFRAKSDIFRFSTILEQNKNALYLITGTPLTDNLLPTGIDDLQNAFNDIKVGLKSDVLLKRPDIMEAEYKLKAANANIGAARAAFFPKITLTSSGGIASNQLNNLFSSSTGVWSFAPSISLPIFDNGNNRANLDYAKAQKNIYVLSYNKAIQTAFKEVNDELATKASIQDRIESYQSLYNASNTSLKLSQQSYDAGINDYLTVLTAQRNLYSVDQEFIDIKAARLTNLINFYKVLAFE